MENNVTNLFKAINFMNKKTLIPTFDDYIIIENGSFILQDAFKTYVLSFDDLKACGNAFVSKSAFLDIKTKNAKYFLETVSDKSLQIKIVTKDAERFVDLPIEKRFVNLQCLIEKEFTCINSINTNGVSLKSILNGYADDITFKFEDEKVMVSMGKNNPYIDFNSEFGELCQLSTEKSDNSISQIVGQYIVDAIGQFGLVKKNSDLNIKFNDKCFMLSNTNLTIYISSNKI